MPGQVIKSGLAFAASVLQAHHLQLHGMLTEVSKLLTLAIAIGHVSGVCRMRILLLGRFIWGALEFWATPTYFPQACGHGGR